MTRLLLKLLPVFLLLVAGLGCLPGGAVRPDPVLLFVVPLAIRQGPAATAAFGWFGGLVVGSLAGGPVALYTATYGLVALGLALLGEDRFEEGPLMPVLLITAGTVAVALTMAGLASWTGVGPTLQTLRGWLPGALGMNLLLVIPANRLVRSLEPRTTLRRGA